MGGCLGMTGVGEGEWKSGTTRRSGSGLAGKVVGKMIVTVSYRVAGSLVCNDRANSSSKNKGRAIVRPASTSSW